MKNLENWKEEFDTEFTMDTQWGRFVLVEEKTTDETDLEVAHKAKSIKAFIESLLTAQTTEMIEKLENMFVEHVDQSDPSKWGEEYARQEKWRTEEHNAVLKRAISLIQELKTNQPQ